MTDLLEKLKGGDRRSIGRVDEVVANVLSNPEAFKTLFDGMLSGHQDAISRRSGKGNGTAPRVPPALQE
jgi:hypothetical protein